MPKVNRSIQKSPEVSLVERLAAVLWSHGDIETAHCRQQIVAAGIKLAECSPAIIHKAEEMNREKLRSTFDSANSDDSQPLKVVVTGDSKLDPALNPNHPIKGAAAVKVAQKQREQEQQQSPAPKQEAKKLQVITHEATDQTTRKHYTIFGHSATSVLRWMGQHGWTVEQAEKALAHYQVGTANLKVRLKEGADGRFQYGPPAPLTDEQAKELDRVAGRSTKPAKKSKK